MGVSGGFCPRLRGLGGLSVFNCCYIHCSCAISGLLLSRFGNANRVQFNNIRLKKSGPENVASMKVAHFPVAPYREFATKLIAHAAVEHDDVGTKAGR